MPPGHALASFLTRDSSLALEARFRINSGRVTGFEMRGRARSKPEAFFRLAGRDDPEVVGLPGRNRSLKDHG